MMQVEIEGPPDDLKGLAGRRGPGGLELMKRVDVLAEDRWKVYGLVDSQEVIDELERRGLTVRVVMDEAEVERRVQLDLDMMDGADDDGGGGPNA